ncbi:MAG TPA: helix-hairpin-helix domain-containing protein [Chryseolinea sp.]|nr:helix-hairpin-helix domain-containing protein [Chryseolinea sp.]
MRGIRRWVKESFALSHSQANGFIVLLPLLGIIIFSGPVWHWYISSRADDRSRDVAILDSLVALWEAQPIARGNAALPSGESTLFHFDPNHATQEELQALGFSTGLATRIDRYRQKGGKFLVKKDLLKIYGIDSSFYKQLSAFIDLPERSEQKRILKERTVYERKSTSVKTASAKFDLNKADTSQLMIVGGIGTKRSQRIIKYRDALGGFIHMDQIQEVYGLDTTVVRRLSVESFIAEDYQPVTMNINSSDEKRLASHPYLSNAAARSIVAYRFQHGEFKTIEELRNIHALDEKTIQKITPYLTLGD